MKRLIPLLASLAALVAATPTLARSHGEPDSVTLSRSPCFGTCPVYTVEVREDGQVTWHGKRFVQVVGDRTARIRPAEARRLIAHFRAARFFTLEDRYAARITDMPTQTLTLNVDGRTKTVVDYAGERAGMPTVVKALEKDVDETAGTRRWIGDRGQP